MDTLYIEKKDDGTYEMSKPQVLWRFTKSQLEAEIENLQKQLTEKQDLLKKIEVL